MTRQQLNIVFLVITIPAILAMHGCGKKKLVENVSVSEAGTGDGTIGSAAPEPSLSFDIRMEEQGALDQAKPTDIHRLNIVNDKPYRDMYFEHYGVNPTIDTDEEPVSTFSIDVDDASFSLARAYLEDGNMPEESAIRVEEFINAFDYDYTPPDTQSKIPFSVQAEMFPSPHRTGYHVLHLGIKGKEIEASERAPANLVFVVDVSGSMAEDNRLGLVKRALRMLVDELHPNDSVAIVVYGSTADVHLRPTTLRHRNKIVDRINRLQTGGSTNAAAGLKLGYQMIKKRYQPDRINRIILCSDGVANTGVTGADGILELIDQETAKGVYLTSVGFGLDNYNDVLMEQLADRANGSYHYVDKIAEARRVFVEQLTGTLQVIAQDVKIQMEFDPNAVSRYRLIGYENRVLENQEFSDDRVDAGEIGAGHTVTALYELRFRDRPRSPGYLRLRYKKPGGSQSKLIDKRIPASIISDSFHSASELARLSVVSATFAEKLRGSYWTRHVDYQQITGWYDGLHNVLQGREDNSQLRWLINTAARLDSRGDKFEKELPISAMNFDRVPILR